MAFLGHDVAKEKSQTTEITTKSVTLLHEDASSPASPLITKCGLQFISDRSNIHC